MRTTDAIKIAIGEINAVTENEVLKAVQSVGISVDKERLIKALQLADEIVYCIDCRLCSERGGHANCNGYLICTLLNRVVDEDTYCAWGERK